MKLMFASDIHGSAYWAKKVLERFEEEQADYLVLLGDLLYHGPRNPLPQDYNPQVVIKLLNSIKHQIIAIRGNCDSEVDEMVLEFPITADYNIIPLKNRKLMASHGHLYNDQQIPSSLIEGDIFIFWSYPCASFKTTRWCLHLKSRIDNLTKRKSSKFIWDFKS